MHFLKFKLQSQSLLRHPIVDQIESNVSISESVKTLIFLSTKCCFCPYLNHFRVNLISSTLNASTGPPNSETFLLSKIFFTCLSASQSPFQFRFCLSTYSSICLSYPSVSTNNLVLSTCNSICLLLYQCFNSVYL